MLIFITWTSFANRLVSRAQSQACQLICAEDAPVKTRRMSVMDEKRGLFQDGGTNQWIILAVIGFFTWNLSQEKKS